MEVQAWPKGSRFQNTPLLAPLPFPPPPGCGSRLPGGCLAPGLSQAELKPEGSGAEVGGGLWGAGRGHQPLSRAHMGGRNWRRIGVGGAVKAASSLVRKRVVGERGPDPENQGGLLFSFMTIPTRAQALASRRFSASICHINERTSGFSLTRSWLSFEAEGKEGCQFGGPPQTPPTATDLQKPKSSSQQGRLGPSSWTPP